MPIGSCCQETNCHPRPSIRDNLEQPGPPPEELRRRIDALNALSDIAHLTSPLDGNAIMETLAVGPGSHLKAAKEFLLNEIIEGRLSENDQDTARAMLRLWWQTEHLPS